MKKKVVIGLVQIKQQYISEFSDSPVKIIFYCSLEIIEGSCYVEQIKIPFNIEKTLKFLFLFLLNFDTLLKKRG